MEHKSPIYYHRVDVDLLRHILSVYVVVGFLIKQLFHRRQSLILKKWLQLTHVQHSLEEYMYLLSGSNFNYIKKFLGFSEGVLWS